MKELRRDVYQAISDPVRREIITLLAEKPRNLNAVANEFPISRPAISKHIKILTECGLIHIRVEGRERFCEAKLESLGEVSEWTNQFKRFWTNKLNALEMHLKNAGKSKPKKK